MKVLWLTSWYPSAVAPFNGDFIQRHAQAASLYEDIFVLYVVKDSTGTITKSLKKTVTKQGRLTETTVYYYTPNYGQLSRLISQWKYRRCFKRLVKEHIAEYGKPDGVHVHVGMKAGMIARWMKKTYGLPYFLTEHWSGLLSEGKPSLNDFPTHFQRAYRQIVKGAISTSAVSAHLSMQMQLKFDIDKPAIIPNVVNTSLFKPALKQQGSSPKFIHISGLTFEKNGAAIIDAFKLLSDQQQPYHLDIFGSQDPKLMRKTSDLGLSNDIHFHPEVPQEQLVSFLHQAEALILYSHFETFGCVAIEAQACGVPVIGSDIPALRELIADGHNGMIAPADSPGSLAQVLIEFITKRDHFNAEIISAGVSERFSFPVVGKIISDWYAPYLSK